MTGTLMNRRVIRASERTAARRAGKNRERKCLQINNRLSRRTIHLSISVQQDMSEELYAVHPEEHLMWLEEKKKDLLLLAGRAAPWTPRWLSVTQPVSKGFPQVTNKNLMEKVLVNPSVCLNHAG